MNKLYYFILILFLSQITTVKSQSFLNGDLDGIISPVGLNYPYHWQPVPYLDSNCSANHPFHATADIINSLPRTFIPFRSALPYSGNTFVAGSYGAISTNVWHEGIQQAVPDFEVGCSYNVNFYQSNVKTHNSLDTSCGWAVYIDNRLIGAAAPTISHQPHNSLNVPWDLRSLSFKASDTTHTIKFLPFDDDSDIDTDVLDLDGAAYVGIDNIYLTNASTTFNLVGIHVSDTSLCFGDSILLRGLNPNATYLWQDSSTNSYYNVKSPGLYWCRVILGCGSMSDTLSDSIRVNYYPQISLDLGKDTILCREDTLALNVYSNNASYIWQDSSTSFSFIIDTAGKYWVEKSANNCSVSDTLNIGYNILSDSIFATDDTSFCEGENYRLRAFQTGASYLWQDSSKKNTQLVSNQGVYWVRVTRNNCSVSDTININYNIIPTDFLGNDTSICDQEKLIIDATFTGASYLWNDNSTKAKLTVDTSGKYWVEIMVEGCSGADSIQVDVLPFTPVNLGVDRILYGQPSAVLDAGPNYATYNWSTGDTTQAIIVDESGNYTVMAIAANGCFGSDDIEVVFLPDTATFIQNNTAKNIEFEVYPNPTDGIVNLFLGDLKNVTLQVYDNWGRLVHQKEQINTQLYNFSLDSSPGLYNLVIQSANNKSVLRLVLE